MRKFALGIVGLTLLSAFLFAVPVNAVLYRVTMKLYSDGTLIWTATLAVDAPTSPITIPVPQELYDTIKQKFGTDTFSTPLSLDFTCHGTMFTLEITSDPNWTIVFVPCRPGDANNDGKINVLDAATVSAHWSGPPFGPTGYDLLADIYFDGKIGVLDSAQVSANWGMGTFNTI